MWRKEEENGIVYFSLPHWQELGAKVVFTCRGGGVSGEPYQSLNLGFHVGDDPAAVTANRRRVLSLFGMETNALVAADQTHTKRIRFVTAAAGGRGAENQESAFPETDGFLTATPGLLLATFYADCLPIVAFDPRRLLLGMAHSGWRGTFADIGGALVATMAARGAKAADLLVATAAGIGPCCYRVDERFYAAFTRRYAGAAAWFRGAEEGCFFDNGLAVKTLLLAAGVREERFCSLPLCTACQERGVMFFSHRRSGGVTGRQGLFAALREEGPNGQRQA